MVKNKTLIVLGAGASNEAGMPTGTQLKARIAQLLNIKFEDWNRIVSGDGLIFEALQQMVASSLPKQININEYLHASWRISEAMPQAISIDNFMEAHQDNKMIELCGKLGIVRSILEAEKKSLLYFDSHNGARSLRFEALENTWFIPFIRLLTENCSIDVLMQRLSLLTFINFNYDRCIEHYIFHAIQNYYGIDEVHAAEMVNNIEIYHPYGTVGSLPWQKTQSIIEFGGTPNSRSLLQLASQIKTFAEGTDSKESNIDDIREKLLEAKIILFLGFAFHRQNMELLKPKARATKHHEAPLYYATALGNSESDAKIIESDIYRLLEIEPDNITVRRELTCNQLLREYWRTLSLSFRI